VFNEFSYIIFTIIYKYEFENRVEKSIVKLFFEREFEERCPVRGGGLMEREPFMMIPGFTFIKRCGVGSSSEVWVASDTHGILRAVRILDKKNRIYSRRENARIASYRSFSENSRHLLHFLHAGETPECYYYVSPLADNAEKKPYSPLQYRADTLFYRLKYRTCSINGIFQRIQEILCGLEDLHRNGMAHNDLKPENILFIRHRLFLADPGLISPSGEKNENGTKGFRPEWEATGIESDIYALGKIIYCMMTTTCDPEHFPALNYNDFDPAFLPLNEIALRCCDRDPAVRFRDCRQIRSALKNLLNDRKKMRSGNARTP
jgi:serine/threonine protein kinase